MSNPNKDVVDYTTLCNEKFTRRKDIAPVETSSTASRAYSAGDKFYYNNLLQKATTDIAQGATLVSGTNFENADPVTTTIQNLSNQVDKNGAVNYLPNRAYTQSIHGVLYTVNNDKTVTVSGTNDGTASQLFVTSYINYYRDYIELPAGTYHLSGCPSGGKVGDNYYYGMELTNRAGNGSRIGWDFGDGLTFTIGSAAVVSLNIAVFANYAISGSLLFKPMIALASYTGEYIPYAETNKQLTVNKVSEELLAEVGGINYVENTATGGGSVATWVINEDKTLTVTVNQTLSSTSRRDLSVSLKKGNYRFCGCPSGGSWGKWSLYPVGNNVSYYDRDTGNGGIMTLSADETITIRMDVAVNTPVGSVITFKPMVCPVSYNGPYVPYAKSNRKLTEDVSNTWIDESVGQDSISVTADGTKTYKTLLNELAAAVLAKAQSLESGRIMEMFAFDDEGDFNWAMPLRPVFLANNASSFSASFMGTSAASDSSANIKSVTVHTTLNSCYMGRTMVTTSGNTFTNFLSLVPASGKKMYVFYKIHRRIY